MGGYENIMRGLTEAVEYRQGALDVRETTLTVEDGIVSRLDVVPLNADEGGDG